MFAAIRRASCRPKGVAAAARLSELSRSDLVLWPFATNAIALTLCLLSEWSGLLRLFFGSDNREGVTLQSLQFFVCLDHLSFS